MNAVDETTEADNGASRSNHRQQLDDYKEEVLLIVRNVTMNTCEKWLLRQLKESWSSIPRFPI
jgi:hypothetical protein